MLDHIDSATRFAAYGVALVAQASLFLVTRRHLLATGRPWSELLSPRGTISRCSFALDFVLGLALLGIVLAIMMRLPAAGSSRSVLVERLLPQDRLELAAWCILSLAAGTSEELAFRGALQHWLTRRIGAVGGIFGQAAIFTAAHAFQGWGSLPPVAGLALLFGVVAHVRRTIFPTIVAHAGVDVLAGIFSLIR